MIVGTAGHIDHGKTALVRALTGVDTDRLPEEKTRGISIELGYAYAEMENGEVLGVIDVPGHERLLHTMVAGACGIDFALLVIAADDGVMPQTREHLAILQLLGVRHGVVALSKADRVDAARLRAVQVDIAALLAPTPLFAVPLFATNALVENDPGVAALRAHLHAAAAQLQARRDDGLFRLAVDRVFTLPGHGTVVTGTVFAGRVCVGDTLALLPAGTSLRLRGLHAQNRPAGSGHAGQRCALNLAGVERAAIARGDWIADPRALVASLRLDVRLRLLDDAGAHLAAWTPLHVHFGAVHRLAHAVPLDRERLMPGDEGLVQLVFDVPVCAAPGDRLIVRNAQATRTLGGGIVLDACAPARRRRSPARLAELDARARLLAGEGLAPLLQQMPQGVSDSELMRLCGLPIERIAPPDDALRIAQHLIARTHWQVLRERALAALREFHTRAPDEPGPDIARLRRIAAPTVPEPLWRALIEELAVDAALVRSGAWLHLPEHTATLAEDERVLADALRPLIAAGRYDPPWVRELAVIVAAPEERIRRVLRKLLRQGELYQVMPDLFYDRARIAELANMVATLARMHGGVEAARYRDALGLGRKRAIQILEFFDRLGYTRRVRTAHVPRADCAWSASS